MNTLSRRNFIKIAGAGIFSLGMAGCGGSSDAASGGEQRHREMPEGSYTTSLFRDGLNRMAQKVGEEALELVIEATNGTNERLVYEGSDMLYHLIVLLTEKGLRIEDLAAELAERHNPGWKKH